MPAAPLHVLHVDEAQICLIDEGRRLERVPYPLTFHVASGHVAQFLVNERQERVSRIRFALFHTRSSAVGF